MITEGLTKLGWIHTHPKFDVYFSSIDLHSQWRMQSEQVSAIGIVCSLNRAKLDVGMLRVKTAYMKTVEKCKKTGHHEHRTAKGEPQWERCSNVKMIKKKIKMIDSRPSHQVLPSSESDE